MIQMVFDHKVQRHIEQLVGQAADDLLNVGLRLLPSAPDRLSWFTSALIDCIAASRVS